MITRRFVLELTYNEDTMHQNQEEREWFDNDVLKGQLGLYSFEICDAVGDVKITHEISNGGNVLCVNTGNDM